jgi:rhodanese-related sulfurtransferase
MEKDKAFATLSAQEARAALNGGEITLIDVREPAEFAAERIHGAFLFPLSTFDPAMLPADAGKPVVFHCGSGKRSADAMERCRSAGVLVKGHLGGGLGAWKGAGCATVVIDPATGKVIDRRF